MEGVATGTRSSRLHSYQGSSRAITTMRASRPGMQAKVGMDGKSKSETNLSENQWIEQTFQKRECIKFVSSGEPRNRCVCGRVQRNHPSLPEGVVRVTYPAEKWNVNKHTEATPTDAYGTIEFQGGPHPTKAQYIRLSYDTKPERILMLLQQFWGLDAPKLLISVHGGIANFDLQPKLRRVWRQGLLKAAKTTGAWIVTGGTNTGVMKHVGDALGDTLIQSRSNIVTLGIVPWGIVHNREELVGRGGNTSFHAMAAPSSNNLLLNSNHSYFLLSDDGTIGRIGFEAILRKKLEKCISQQISTRSSGKDYTTPVVYLILEGGCNTIRTVLDCVMENPPFPVVVIDGSGRAADLLAFAHKYASDDGTMQEALRDQLILTIKRTFCCTTESAEKTFIELMMCMKNKKHLITVFRIQEQAQDIDQAILAALLKSQNASAPDQLSRALAWDRVDIAQSHIFVYGQDWPEGALDQAMMDALANNRVDFVKLLIENGVNMNKWLTIERLEELYNVGLVSTRSQPVKAMFASTRHQHDTSSTLKHLLKELKMKHLPSDYRYSLLDIGQVINKLMSGAYRSTYCRKKFRLTYNAVMNKGGVGKVVNSIPVIDPLPPVNNRFRYPYSELMVWAVLLRRQKMARFMWERGEEALAKALVACKLFKSMAHEAEEDELAVDVANELRRYSGEFANLAHELLEHCFKTDDDLTQLLLTYELSNWSDQSCMSLATSANHRPFIASTGCQIVVTEMWMGGLRTRKYANTKVFLGIFFFPLILLMDYRSVEELQMMPQTVEEHIQDLKGSVGDSDSDSDTASVASRHSTQSDRQPKEGAQSQVAGNSSMSPASESETKPTVSPSLEAFVPNTKHSPLRLGRKIYEFYTAPITKFWMNAISYTIFLLMFIYIVLIRTPDTPQWQEWYIIVYMIGWVMEKVREFANSEPTRLRQKLRVYFTDLWNVFDMLILIFFFIGMALRFVPGLTKDARIFYCLSVALSITRIVDFLAVSQHLGPLVHIIGKMMVKLLYFIVFVLISLVAFGTFRQSIWFPYEDFKWESVREIFLKPYFMLYGEVYADIIWPPCEVNLTEPTGTDQDAEQRFPCVPGRWLVPVALSIFLIIGIILLLSVLIAVFNSVFNRTYVHSNQVWKCQRYTLVIEYESKPMLPSPLIILCHFYQLLKFCRRKWLHKKKLLDNGLRLFLDEISVEKLHDFEEECMEIYYREKENLKSLSIEAMLKMTVEKLESVNLRVDDIIQKQNSLRTSLGVLESHVVAHENGILESTQVLYDLQRFILARPSQVTSLDAISMHPTTHNLPAPCNFAATTAEGFHSTGDSPPFTTFNEKKLGPFTEYRRFERRQGWFGERQYSSSHSFVFPPTTRNPAPKAAAARFQRQSCISRRTRHSSCDACPQQTNASDIDHLASSREEKPDLHIRFCLESDPTTSRPDERLFKDESIGTTSLAPALIAEENTSSRGVRPNFRGLNFLPVGDLQRSSSGGMMPFSPIITPIRTEYTSITDDIDTTCVGHRSPPNTPTMLRWTDPETKRKKGGGRRRKRTLPNDQLKKAEETVHKQMEFMVHKRIRQLSLTETESTGNLAKHALESLVDGSEDDNDDDVQLGHHSDDEASTAVQATTLDAPGLKPIRSEPVLAKKMRTDDERSDSDAVSGNANLFVDRGGLSDDPTPDDALSFRVKLDVSTPPPQATTPPGTTPGLKRSRPLDTDVAVSFAVSDDGRQSPSLAFMSRSNSSR